MDPRSRTPLARSAAASVIVTALAVAVAGGACSSFSSESAPGGDGGTSPGADAAADGAAEDGEAAGDAAPDAPAGPVFAALGPTCPRPPAPTCTLTSCSVVNLSDPPTPTGPSTFPFGIGTDGKSVYWLEITAKDAIDSTNAYDGAGPSRVRRVPKSGGAAVTLATGQTNATRLVVDGDFVYWAAQSAGPWKLRRVRRDCAPEQGCEIEDVANLPDPLSRLLRARPGLLVAQTIGGDVLRIAVTSVTTPSVGKTNDFPSLTVTNDTVYAGSALLSHVDRASLDGGTLSPFASLPADAGGRDPGFALLTTNCKEVFGLRGPGTSDPYRISASGIVTLLGAGAGGSVFDAACDVAYLYTAGANSGGVVAYDLVTGAPTVIAAGESAFAIAVDDDGVYWGEHHRSPNAGAIRMLRKK